MTRARRRGRHRGRRANTGLDAGITLPAAVLALAALTATSAAAQSLLTGPVTHVRDGDTIEIGAGSGAGARAGAWAVRLEGLHAPERGTSAGERAAAWMRRTALGRIATCRLAVAMSYDRAIGVCRIEGADLAAGLVAAGLGRDCPRYSGGRYRPLETEAGKALTLPDYCRLR